MLRTSRLAFALIALLVACEQAPSKLDSVVKNNRPPAGASTGVTTAGAGPGSATAPAGPVEDLDSHDVLNRKDTAPTVYAKHVLISWKDLEKTYGGHQDPRGAARTNADAAKTAREVAERAKTEDFDKLVNELGEDPGMKSGEPYKIDANTSFVPEFKNLALRLMVNEVGIVKTEFGYHVIKRIAAPAPDPLESADILARPAEAGPVTVQHLLIGWKETGASKDRTKADADKAAKEALDKARAGADMAELTKTYAEGDRAKANAGKTVEIGADMQGPEEFKNLALRLKVGETGLVKSMYGWHLIKRVAPLPPDTLESSDILARQPVTQYAKVKHILLSFSETHGDDPRGKTRDRATLEKLVKDTVAKLKGGAKIEPLMTELSEDPGSAKTGNSYDVTPDAGLVKPFKDLSLRLKSGEVGVVKTEFGFHIIQRVDGMPGEAAGSGAPAGAGSATKAPAEKPAAGSGSAAPK